MGSRFSLNFPKSILIFETFSNSFCISVIFYKGLRYKRTQTFSDTWDTLTLNVQIILQHVRKWHLQNLFYHVFNIFLSKKEQINQICFFRKSEALSSIETIKKLCLTTEKIHRKCSRREVIGGVMIELHFWEILWYNCSTTVVKIIGKKYWMSSYSVKFQVCSVELS